MKQDSQKIVPPKYPLKTLSTALDILDYIKTHGKSDGVTLNAISKSLGLNKSTAHRILDTLLFYNYVTKTTGSVVFYKLGWGLYHTGAAVPQMYKFEKSNYREIISRVSQELDLKCTMYIEIDGFASPTLEVFEGETLTAESIFRQRLPLYASAPGKLFMIDYDENDILEYFQNTDIRRYTSSTILNYIEFLDELRLISQRGYATDREEFQPNSCSIAYPIRDYTGKNIAAVNVNCSAENYEKEKNRIISCLKENCSILSEYLGEQL